MTNKKYLGLIVLILLGAVAVGSWFYLNKITVKPTPQSISGVKLYFLPESFSVKSGDNFTVALRIDPVGKKITAQELYFSFNSELVNLNRITTSTAFSVALMPAEINNQTGQASITLGAPPTAPVGEESDVLYLNFTAEDQVGRGVVKVENNSQVAAIGMTANVLEGFGALQLRINRK
ncbi:MAG: cohesin domain-containing protein [Patescibacteria group bacterium]